MFTIVIYFSAVVSIFYYWGLMQFIVCKIAWVMQLTMGTTAIESLNAAANIFIGMVCMNLSNAITGKEKVIAIYQYFNIARKVIS